MKKKGSNIKWKKKCLDEKELVHPLTKTEANLLKKEGLEKY